MFLSVNCPEIPDSSPSLLFSHGGWAIVATFGKDEKISRTVANLQFFSHQKYPLSVLAMPLKNHMGSSLVPLFQKVKEGIHIY